MTREKHVTQSEGETFLLAKRLAQGFRGEEIVLLEGELGAGKTVFTKGIAAGLGLKDVHQVCSPSFTLMNIYKARYPIYHIDLYRLGKDSEISELGWEDYVGQGIIVVEWAEKLKYELSAIRVKIAIDDTERRTIVIER